jgi:hypothetical protein
MATKNTKGGIEDLKAFLNEVIEDITEEDDKPMISESQKKNQNIAKNIDRDELRKIKKEISESIKASDDDSKTDLAVDEIDTLNRIDELIDASKPDVENVSKQTETAKIADPVDKRVEVVEVFEEKLIEKLGSKSDDTFEIIEEQDPILQSKPNDVVISGSNKEEELPEEGEDYKKQEAKSAEEKNNDITIVAVMAAIAAFVGLLVKLIL